MIIGEEIDTETLLAALEFWDLEVVLNKLVGMFAFGLYDIYSNRLTLVRDRFGEKPLYFGIPFFSGLNSGKCLFFASELTAFKALKGFSNSINKEAFFSYTKSDMFLHRYLYMMKYINLCQVIIFLSL